MDDFLLPARFVPKNEQTNALGYSEVSVRYLDANLDRPSGSLLKLTSPSALEKFARSARHCWVSQAAELRGSVGHELVALGDAGRLQPGTRERDSQAEFADGQR